MPRRTKKDLLRAHLRDSTPMSRLRWRCFSRRRYFLATRSYRARADGRLRLVPLVGREPLAAIGVTMPPCPGESESPRAILGASNASLDRPQGETCKFSISHAAFKGQNVAVETAGFFRGARVLHNGNPVEKRKGRYTVRNNARAGNPDPAEIQLSSTRFPRW